MSQDFSRREFIRNAGIAAAGVALGGVLPSPVTRGKAFAAAAEINFGYILSDHHAPLMVLARNWELFQEKYHICLKPVAEGKQYDFVYDGAKIARVRLVPVSRGPDLIKLFVQGSIDFAFSGTQDILLTIDQGVDAKLVAPMQTAGNVFVLKKDIPMNTWEDFVKSTKGSKMQFKVGMPGPNTVAGIIFKSALDHEGITHTEDISRKNADILLINMKGHGNLVTALTNAITDGIVGAQPFPAVTINNGIGKLVLNLEDVPPKMQWKGHACCSVEATRNFVSRDKDLMVKLMELVVLGIQAANSEVALTAKTCAAWLGVDEVVEKAALPTMTFAAEPIKPWTESVYTYMKTMDGMNMFTGKLRQKRGPEIDPLVFDFSYLDKARANLKGKKFVA